MIYDIYHYMIDMIERFFFRGWGGGGGGAADANICICIVWALQVKVNVFFQIFGLLVILGQLLLCY